MFIKIRTRTIHSCRQAPLRHLDKFNLGEIVFNYGGSSSERGTESANTVLSILSRKTKVLKLKNGLKALAL
jgi:hypothetical protein